MRERGFELGGVAAAQHRERVDRDLAVGGARGLTGAFGRECQLRAAQFECGAVAAGLLGADQGGDMPAFADRRGGEQLETLGGPEGHVLARDLAGKRERRVVGGGEARVELVAGGLAGAAVLAPEIEFPGGVDAGGQRGRRERGGGAERAAGGTRERTEMGMGVPARIAARGSSTAANGRLAFGIFAAFAEFERELIVERTTAGLAAARARGRMGGRPRKMDRPTLLMAMSALADRTAVAATLGLTTTTLYVYVKRDARRCHRCTTATRSARRARPQRSACLQLGPASTLPPAPAAPIAGAATGRDLGCTEPLDPSSNRTPAANPDRGSCRSAALPLPDELRPPLIHMLSSCDGLTTGRTAVAFGRQAPEQQAEPDRDEDGGERLAANDLAQLGGDVLGFRAGALQHLALAVQDTGAGAGRVIDRLASGVEQLGSGLAGGGGHGAWLLLLALSQPGG